VVSNNHQQTITLYHSDIILTSTAVVKTSPTDEVYHGVYIQVSLRLFLYMRVRRFMFLYMRVRRFMFLYMRVRRFMFLYMRVRRFMFFYDSLGGI
jgi:hypothetical protein